MRIPRTITKSPIRLARSAAVQVAVEHMGGGGVGIASATTYARKSPVTVSAYPNSKRLRSNSTREENRAHSLTVRNAL